MRVVGWKLKAIREGRYLERAELAKKAGTSYTTLVKMENSNYTPRVRVVRRIAKVLGVKPEVFTEPKHQIEGFEQARAS